MAAASDPYRVLGVSPGASEAQLHAAYRRLVLIHHPDHNDGSPESARQFEEIQEAYARIRALRARAPRPEPVAPDPELDSRLSDLEQQVRQAHAARERAARERARRAAAKAPTNAPRRPSDEELGYVRTDDSFTKILADAEAELSERLAGVQEHPEARRVGRLIDDLTSKLKRDIARDRHR